MYIIPRLVENGTAHKWTDTEMSIANTHSTKLSTFELNPVTDKQLMIVTAFSPAPGFFIEASTELYIDPLVEQMKDPVVTLFVVTSHKHDGKLVTPITPASTVIKSVGTSFFFSLTLARCRLCNGCQVNTCDTAFMREDKGNF